MRSHLGNIFAVVVSVKTKRKSNNSFLQKKKKKGFAVTKENNETNVLVVECVKLEEIDPEQAKAGLQNYRTQMESAGNFFYIFIQQTNG